MCPCQTGIFLSSLRQEFSSSFTVCALDTSRLNFLSVFTGTTARRVESVDLR